MLVIDTRQRTASCICHGNRPLPEKGRSRTWPLDLVRMRGWSPHTWCQLRACGHRYAAPFREDVQAWLKRLGTVGECVEGWLSVQSLWMYMEAVFSGGDIVKQLPAEAKRFQAIDKSFMRVRPLGSENLLEHA